MRVAAYVHIRRTRLDLGTTGVGKHICEVVRGLAAQPNMELQVLGAREDLQDGKLPPTSPLQGLPFKSFGLPRKYMEAAWSFLHWPKVESWTGPVDWVYCPAEAYVARRKAKFASVVHCINWLDPELPWYNDPDIVAARPGWKTRFRLFRDSADLLLPVSNFLAKRMTELCGISPKKMRVVGNGVEECYLNAPPLDDEWKKRVGDRPFVMVVGGLTRRKGGECVLNVARELLKRKSHLRILVCGVGEEQFNPQAREVSNIVPLGYVGAETGLPALLRASAALLFPSRYETFGIPAVEAMAAGTPAVVSHFAALPEVVGDAGVIVDPSQPAAIADTLDNLARDSALRAKHVDLGRKRAHEFHWNRCIQRTADALREFSGH